MKENNPIKKIENWLIHPTPEQAQRRAYFFENLMPDELLNRITNNAIDVNRPKVDYPFFPRKKK